MHGNTSSWPTPGSALWGKPMTHMPDVRRTAFAARDLIPCTVVGAIPIAATPKAGAGPDVCAVETGSFFGVTSADSESLAPFRGLAQAFLHHPNGTSGSASRVDSQVAGPSHDNEIDPWLQQPLRSKVSVLTPEQHACSPRRGEEEEEEDRF